MRARSAAVSRANSVRKTPLLPLQRQLAVLVDRVALEHRRALELAPDAELRDPAPRRAW